MKPSCKMSTKNVKEQSAMTEKRKSRAPSARAEHVIAEQRMLWKSRALYLREDKNAEEQSEKRTEAAAASVSVGSSSRTTKRIPILVRAQIHRAERAHSTDEFLSDDLREYKVR